MEQEGQNELNETSSGPPEENQLNIRYQTELENEKLYALFMQAPSMIAVLRGPEHIFELANPKYMELVGIHRPILGRSAKDALPEIAGQGFIEILDEVYRSRQPFVGNEMRVALDRHQNGSLEEVFLNFVFQPTLDSNGNIYGIFGHGVDITEQVISRRRIEESEEKYRTLLDKLDQGFCILEVIFMHENKPVDYRFIEVNPMFERQTGLLGAVGKTARELVPGLESHWFEIYGKVALTGEPYNFTEGSEAMGRWFEVNAFRIGGSESRKVALFFTDISDRMRREVELRESEERFRNLADTAPIFMAMADDTGNAVYFNKPWLEWTGRTMEELAGLGWLCTLHPEDAPKFEKDFKQAFQDQKNITEQYRFRRADGVYRWMLAVGAPRIQEGKFVGYFGTYTDFHELKQAQEALKESEERLSLAMQATRDGVWDWDFKNDKAWWDQRYIEITGINIPEEERSLRAASQYIPPKDVEAINAALKAHLEKGREFEFEYRAIRPSGEIRNVYAKGKAVTDENGEVTRLTGTLSDITERKEAETLLKLKNEELMRINNDLDNFIYTASHDLKAPMSNIEGLLNALKAELEFEKDSVSEDTNVLLQLIQKSINRFKTTILDLTEITKVQKGEDEDVLEINLAQIVEDVKLSIYDKIVESRATIDTDFSQVNTIKFSKKNLKSIIYNLLGNAIKYRDRNRSPEIFIKTEKSEDDIILKVKDNGLGISKENQNKIFGMFKRVHDHVEGTGIGLYIVKRIIDNAGGSIEVDSEVGKGTTFIVRIPIIV